MRRSDDARSRDLLLDCARLARDFRLAIAWTGGLEGDAAKACFNGWKHARPLPEGDDRVLSSFASRCRTNNPCVVAGASGLVLVESDGGMLGVVCAELGLPVLPPTLGALSRRGSHGYFKPPARYHGPRKIELAADGVTASGDGYLVLFGARHATGHIYQPLNPLGGIATIPIAFLEAAIELGREHRAVVIDSGWSDDGAGERIPEGQRTTAVFTIALQAVRAGLGFETVARELVAVNRSRCVPPLDDAIVVRQVEGAVRYANGHDPERAAAEQALHAALAARHDPEPGPNSAEPAATVPARPRRDSFAAVVALLGAELADGAWHDAATVKATAFARLGANERTVRRAAGELGVERDRRGFPAVAVWRLKGRT